jgi:hypothetical protein
VTSGGLYRKGHQPPFDLERERREPTWGDPSFRTLTTNMAPEELGVSQFLINQASVLSDMNILLPIQRFRELANAPLARGYGNLLLFRGSLHPLPNQSPIRGQE